MTYDITIAYDEEDKDVVHDISVHMTPRLPRRPDKQVKRKVREKVTRRVVVGYRKKSGGFASKAYAKRYPHLVKRAYRTKTSYRTVTKTVTVRGARYTERDAFKALWAAHKQAIRGEAINLDDWVIDAVDWTKSNSGDYHYSDQKAIEAAIISMGGILEDENTTTNIHLRAGELDQGPEDA